MLLTCAWCAYVGRDGEHLCPFCKSDLTSSKLSVARSSNEGEGVPDGNKRVVGSRSAAAPLGAFRSELAFSHVVVEKMPSSPGNLGSVSIRTLGVRGGAVGLFISMFHPFKDHYDFPSIPFA